MKTNVLPSQKRKKERYALKAFLWGAVMAALFIVPSMIIDKGMYLYYGDYNTQVIPFYQIMVDAVHSGQTGWSWYTDLGSSFVGSYTFYNLGSPFFWILLLFPTNAVPYLLGPLTILKFGLSSLTAYGYIKRYTKNKNNAVAAAMLYAFSGAAIYNMVFHFIDAMVIFPLLLIALDKYVYEDKRGLFAFMVFTCAITNYYFFAAEAVFCLIYWIVRMASGSYRMDSRRSFYLVLEAILGTGLSVFVLLPTVYHIVGSNRVSSGELSGMSLLAYESGYAYITTLISLFMPPELAETDVYVRDYAHTWTSITAYLPLFGMSGVFAVVFNKHKNKWLRVFYGVSLLFMLVPVLNSTFQMFTDAKYMRWFFMLLFVMALGSVMALEDPSTKWKKAITANLLITMLIILCIGFIPGKSMNSFGREVSTFGLSGAANIFWILAAAALINIGLSALFIALYKKNREAFRRFGALIVSAAIIITALPTVIINKAYGEDGVNPVKLGFLNAPEDMGIDDIQNCRSEIVTNFTYSLDMYDGDTVGTVDYAYFEKKNSDYQDLLVMQDPEGLYLEDDNATLFWRIPGFGSFHSLINSSITDFYSGMGFERETLSNLPIGMYGYRSFTSTKYLFNHSDSVLSVNDENGDPVVPGYKYLKSWNGFDIYENEYAVPIGSAYDKFMLSSELEDIPGQYRHLVLLDTVLVDSFEDMWNYVELGMQQVHASDFEFTREEYFKNCEERKALGVYDFTRDKKGFEAKIKLEPGGMNKDNPTRCVLFTVPYDKGWSAYVDGEKAKIKVADFGFMAVNVPAGKEVTIRFNYHTPGTMYGFFVSGICLVMLLIYLAVVKLGQNNAQLAEGTPDGSSDTDNNEDKKETTDGSADTGSPDGEKEKTPEGTPEENALPGEDFEDMSVFDIVKQTEEEHMMHVYNRVPVVLERGSGAVGYDIDDKKYIDFTSGIGVNALGYADGRWIDAVEKQLRSVQHTSNLYYNTTQIQLAEALCLKTGFSKVFFANSGAEANECAIKIARKYGSDKLGEKHTHIITLENSFHGRTITTLSATGQDVFHKYFTPFTDGFSFAKANDMDSIKSCTTEDTCAVMIELIQGEGGVNPLDQKFVTELAAYCKENDLLLIVDEIQTGVGRTGKFYCYENYGIQPDVITTAKALGGGLPLSACMCNEKLKDVLTAGTNGTTFGGNPIACAGAMTILDIVGDEEFLAEVRAKGEYMREKIKAMKGVKEVRGLGLMIGIVLEKDNAGDVLSKCAENGLLVLTAKGLIRLLPPLNIEYEDIDEGLEILEKAILA